MHGIPKPVDVSSNLIEGTSLTKYQRYRKKLKTKVLEAYGTVCACCHEHRYEFLTVDHINEDGAEHRRLLGAVKDNLKMYRELLKNPRTDIQILCWNCNCAKSAYGKCPHQDLTTAVTDAIV